MCIRDSDSGYPNLLSLVGLKSTLVLEDAPEPPLEVDAGFASVLNLRVLGSTLVLEDAPQPGLELLSGMALSMSLRGLNSTLSLTTPPAGEKHLLSGLAQRLTLRGLGVTLDTDSNTSPAYGEWFLEVVMPNRRVRVENQTSSLQVRNARKRVRSELKTRVKY